MTVYLEWPPLAESSYVVNQETVETIRTRLAREPALRILHGEQPVARPDADFFDTHYHLTGIAKRQRTADLAEALIPALAKQAASGARCDPDQSRTMSSLIRPYQPHDQAEVVALWQACGLTRPWNDPVKDIARKLQVRPDWFLVVEVDGTIVASVMVGYDGHRGWLNYLGVSPTVQRQGWGRKLVEHAERLLIAEGCPKLNLQVRGTNTTAIEFYRSLGYDVDDVVSLGKRLIPDQTSSEPSPPSAPA